MRLNQKIVRNGRSPLTVVGITANFHQLGLQKIIDPDFLILLPRPNISQYYSLKINGRSECSTVREQFETDMVPFFSEGSL